MVWIAETPSTRLRVASDCVTDHHAGVMAYGELKQEASRSARLAIVPYRSCTFFALDQLCHPAKKDRLGKEFGGSAGTMNFSQVPCPRRPRREHATL